MMIQPGAFGDIIVCAPIAKAYSDAGYDVYWPVRKQFLDMVSGLRQELSFSDLLKELISWELTNPEKNYHNFRNYSRYGKLSGYAHSEEKTHDISRLKRYFGNDEQKAIISESMIIPQLSKEYLSDMLIFLNLIFY